MAYTALFSQQENAFNAIQTNISKCIIGIIMLKEPKKAVYNMAQGA
jgi:hypothetical protein